MVGIQHQRVGGDIGERRLVLFLRIDLVRGAELLDVGGVQAHPFLQLGGDDHPLALGFRQFRLHVALAAHSQGVCGHIAGVGAKHTGDGVPEGGFSVPALAVGNDQGFNVDLADGGKPHNLLHIANQVGVPLEEGLEGVLPDIHAVPGRVHRRLFRDIVLGVVFPDSPRPQIAGAGRQVQ